MMEFPRDTMHMTDGCIAVIGNGRGPNGKKWVGKPIIYTRPGLRWQGELWQASRLSYHLSNASIPRNPENLRECLVLHTCDHEWCVNPKHLYLGSAAQNTKDKWDRHPTVRQDINRSKKGRSLSPEHRAKISKSQTGRKASPETRAKMSVSQKAHWAQERI